MKKVLMFFLASVLLTGTAAAQYDVGYLAFFTDETRVTHCISEASIPDPPGNLASCYVYCAPALEGQRAAVFQVNMPANTSVLTTIDGPYNDLVIGDLFTGIELTLSECLYNWHWIFRIVFYVNDNSQTALTFGPSGVSGELKFATCEQGYPEYPIIVLNSLYLNMDPGDPGCVYATKETSWGAIKSMYKE